MVNVIDHVRHDTKMYFASLRVQFKAATALRGAFIAQVVGMVLNNLALMASWIFFFQRFGTIHGWGIADFIAMQGLAMIIYGVLIFACSGLEELPRYVDTGSFDGFLTKPTSVLGQVGSSKTDISTVGDVLLGVVLVGWYIMRTDVSAMAMLLFFASTLVALVVFWCFVLLLPYVLAFYMFDSERLSRYFGVIFLDAMNYPGGVLAGAIRMVFLVGIPALFVGVVPVDVLRGLHWEWVGYGALLAVFWLVVCLWLFRRAIRRYESANLIGAR